MPCRPGALYLEPDHARLLAPSCALATHGRQRTDATFVARPPRLDALAQPGLLVRQALVERLLCDGLVGQPLVLLGQEGRVVSRPRGQPPTVDVHDARGHPLEKGTVVCDEHDRARIVLEEALQPEDSVEVEVIGRLVEQEHIRLGHQARASNTRRLHPPDSVSTLTSGCRLSRVSTSSTRCSKHQPSRSSSSWCRRPSSQAGNQTDEYDWTSLPQEAPDDGRVGRPQGQANADFASAAGRGLCRHTIHADTRESEGKRREDTKEGAEQALARRRLVHNRLHRPHVDERQVGI